MGQRSKYIYFTYGSAHGRSRIKNGSSVRLMKFLLVTWAGLSVLIMACVCPVATADRTRPWRTFTRPFLPRAQGQVKISSHSSCMAARRLAKCKMFWCEFCKRPLGFSKHQLIYSRALSHCDVYWCKFCRKCVKTWIGYFETFMQIKTIICAD